MFCDKILAHSLLTTYLNYQQNIVMGNLITGEILDPKSSKNVFDVYQKIPLSIEGIHHLIRMHPLLEWEKTERHYVIKISLTTLKKAVFGRGKTPQFMRKFFNKEQYYLEQGVYGCYCTWSHRKEATKEYSLRFIIFSRENI